MTQSVRTSIILLRLGIGWLLFYAGWSKVVTFFTEAQDWTATGYILGNVKAGGHPFANLLEPFANNVLVDYLNAYGLLLIGLTLILGLLVRWSAFWGIILMILYYLSIFPPEHAFVVDDHVIYALVLIFLAVVGAGRIWGLDKTIENSSAVKNSPWMLKILG